jgi:nicotinamidase-related amidase
VTTLPDRPATALLVIDLQQGVVGEAFRRDAVVGNIRSLVDRARVEGVPVVWVQNESEETPPGSDAWRFVDGVNPTDDDRIVAKRYGDAFEESTLEHTLAAAGVGRLIVTGAETDACIRSTIHGAFVRGYDVTLVGDAHTANDLTEWGNPPPEQVIAHTNLYWKYHTAPGRTADVVDASDVSYS